MRKNEKVLALTQGALIAAAYVVLTHFANMLGLASGAIQVRLSEALTVLPYFTPVAVPGLFIGCLIANITTGCAVWDIIFGSIATLFGAIGTRLFRKYGMVAAVIPPILSNTLIVPFVISYVYGTELAIPYLMLTVAIGEIISCGILGGFFMCALRKNENAIKWAGRSR
ncbi:MAG: QueT transporter family protein [Ruminococcus sp.]|nr:QueT transporter family protein [Ruminococcus sp.]